jgi:hypothetical protein
MSAPFGWTLCSGLTSVLGVPREVVEELKSPDGKRRATVLRGAEGTFHVELARLVPGNELEPTHWSPLRGPVVIADTLERARELALEGLNGV